MFVAILLEKVHTWKDGNVWLTTYVTSVTNILNKLVFHMNNILTLKHIGIFVSWSEWVKWLFFAILGHGAFSTALV